jgi:hypothetical protein
MRALDNQDRFTAVKWMTNQYRHKVMNRTSAAMEEAHLVTASRLITMTPTSAINGLYGATEDAYDSPYAQDGNALREEHSCSVPFCSLGRSIGDGT